MRSAYLKMVAAASAIFAFGCSNPAGDYADFRARVASVTDAGTVDSSEDTAPDAPVDGSIFDEAGVDAFSGDYWSVCLDKSYAGDIEKAIYDVFHLKFTQGVDGAVTVSGTREALRYGATNVSDQVGESVVLPETPVDASGAFAIHVATFITPKEANVFQLDLTVENGIYSLRSLTPESACGHFLGKVTSPIPQDVDETCILGRPAADGSFVPLPNTDTLHCP